MITPIRYTVTFQPIGIRMHKPCMVQEFKFDQVTIDKCIVDAYQGLVNITGHLPTIKFPTESGKLHITVDDPDYPE